MSDCSIILCTYLALEAMREMAGNRPTRDLAVLDSEMPSLMEQARTTENWYVAERLGDRDGTHGRPSSGPGW